MCRDSELGFSNHKNTDRPISLEIIIKNMHAQETKLKNEEEVNIILNCNRQGRCAPKYNCLSL